MASETYSPSGGTDLREISGGDERHVVCVLELSPGSIHDNECLYRSFGPGTDKRDDILA
ncbi:MAG TPA: hypothetical protein VI685_23055 [Candidatus Angelobacter sp.]